MVEAAKRTTSDTTIQKEIMQQVLLRCSELDYDATPPQIASWLYEVIFRYTGDKDIYKQTKEWSNEKALELLDKMHSEISRSQCKFETAVRLAIAGNIIDFGAKSHVSDDMIEEVVSTSLTMPMNTDNIKILQSQVNKANSILYLLDNAGEIVFDRLLLEQLPQGKVTAVVRGRPIINDVTMADAHTAGLTNIVRVIDNGSGAPGTIIDDCSDEFQKEFEKADLIIAKGQGNFETLNMIKKNIFFLLKVKCPVVAQNIGLPIGSMVIQKFN